MSGRGTCRRPVGVAVDIGKVNFGWVPDPIAEYLMWKGIPQANIDARCANYQSLWSNGTSEIALLPEARNRLYDEDSPARQYTFIGHPWVAGRIRGNDIARQLGLLLFAHGNRTGLDLEDLTYIPGLYGIGHDTNFTDHWLRPVSVHELNNRFSKFVVDLAKSFSHCAPNSPSGLFCFDSKRIHHLRNFARSMKRHRMIAYKYENETILIPCTYSDPAWELVEFIRDLRIDELRRA